MGREGGSAGDGGGGGRVWVRHGRQHGGGGRQVSIYGTLDE